MIRFILWGNQPSSNDRDGWGPGRWEKEPERLEGGCSSQAEAIQGWHRALEGIWQARRELRLPLPNSLGVIALFCRQYDIIKDNEPNNNKEKTKSASETSTPEHQGGGLLRSKVRGMPWLGGCP